MKGLHYVGVDPNIADDPAIATMAEKLRKDRYWVAGHFPRFFGAIASHAPDGMIGEIPLNLLDEWAGGVKGWGRLVLDLLCEDGLLRSWRKYNGRSLEKLAKDRERKGGKVPRKVRGKSKEIPRNVHGVSAPVTTPHQTNSRDLLGDSPPRAVSKVRNPLPLDRFSTLKPLPTAEETEAKRREILISMGRDPSGMRTVRDRSAAGAPSDPAEVA